MGSCFREEASLVVPKRDPSEFCNFRLLLFFDHISCTSHQYVSTTTRVSNPTKQLDFCTTQVGVNMRCWPEEGLRWMLKNSIVA